LVQQELHPQDEGREGDGNSGQPVPDEAAAGVSEALIAADTPGNPALTLDAGIPAPSFDSTPFPRAEAEAPIHPALPVEPAPLAPEARLEPEPVFELAPPPDAPRAEPAQVVEQAHPFDQVLPFEPALAMVAAAPEAPASGSADMRLDIDDRATAMMQRLSIWKDELIAWFKTLASAAVYATLIVTFGFQVARVEGQSMAPTLADQDRLIVNKLAYRIGEPRRGDIVMLYYPLNPDKSFVKRVIAEEGDQVRIVDGRVYVNDVPLRDDFVPPEFRSHDDFGPTVIPDGYYFVMGDHRNNSSDSRHWGMVPKKYIIGKVQLRWWPLPTARVF
jgi:signal peptidase I